MNTSKTQKKKIPNKVTAAAMREARLAGPIVEVHPVNIMTEAESVIYGDRENTYGDPSKNLRAIADYWTVHLKHKYNFTGQLTTDDVCQLMVTLKQARLLNTPTHHDSQVDTVGYMGLMERVQNADRSVS
jgi:hypothetical protein